MYQNRGGLNNNLLEQFNRQRTGQNTFTNNAMLNNNVHFKNRINDQSFMDRIKMDKLEQIKKAKGIKDIGLNKEQLTEYVICPIKLKRTSADEINNTYTALENGMKGMIEEYWKARTNQPYKNILKDQNYQKKFEKKEDLIVHKVSDKDKLGLLDDYDKLMNIINNHNNQLKNIYSTSERNKHKKEFDYIQKYKYRLKYDPKDFEDLKNMYKKEQKKISHEKKQIDVILNALTESQLTEEDIKLLNDELMEDEKEIEQVRDIEQILRDELKDDYDAIMKQLEDSDSDRSSVSSGRKKKKTTVKTEKANVNNKKKFTVTTITKKEDIPKIKTEIDELKDKYKNRK